MRDVCYRDFLIEHGFEEFLRILPIPWGMRYRRLWYSDSTQRLAYFIWVVASMQSFLLTGRPFWALDLVDIRSRSSLWVLTSRVSFWAFAIPLRRRQDSILDLSMSLKRQWSGWGWAYPRRWSRTTFLSGVSSSISLVATCLATTYWYWLASCWEPWE